MGVLGGSYGNMPGVDTAYSTYEQSFGWGPYPRVVYILPKQIDANAIDARFTGTTWRLAPGLVMGMVASTGKFKQYDPTATDGTQIAAGILMESYRMQDVFSGANVDKQAGMMVAGPVRAAGLGGLDQKARYDLKCQGFIFDDDPRGPVGWRVIEGAFGNVTTVIPTPAVGATYQNGTHFIVTSGAGTATFTLPTIAPGLRYKFSQEMDQTLVVQGAVNDIMVGFNDNAASNVQFAGGGAKIGGTFEVMSIYDGSVYKWLVMTESAGANTVTTNA